MPWLLEPTLNAMDPPRPVVALPVAIVNAPELPLVEAPVVNFICPLTPATPASTVFKRIEPVDVAVPAPLERLTEPPVPPAPTPPAHTK